MIDKDQLVDRETAAAFVGVSPHTIDNWTKGAAPSLVRTATGPRGKALYRLGAVSAAERKNRGRAKRRLARRPARI